MIKPKDVIRMKVPYPSISDGMAMKSHMYICRTQFGTNYEYIKCQTLKPYMLINNPISRYHDEKPDLTRNPFAKPTRIDCDKIFSTYIVSYDERLKTGSRPDVCDDLFSIIENELLLGGYSNIKLNETELKRLNRFIY